MQASKKKKGAETTVHSPSALENCGNRGGFPMTRKKASVTPHLQGERAEGEELHTRFRPQGNSGTGAPASHFKAHEGREKDSEHSVWISQGQILPDQPDCLLQWDD